MSGVLRRSWPERYLALGARLLLLLRVLAVVLGLQVSGIGSAGAEAVWLVSDEMAGAPERCPEDHPCDDCPPSCPNCHCSNGIVTVVPTLAMVGVTAFVGVKQRQERIGAVAPLVPDPASLFRPPCSAAVSLG
jgi:hypothetical protein